MVEVFLDTNVIIDTQFFQSSMAETFLKGAKFHDITVLIPEIVIDETKGRFESDLKERFSKYKKMQEHLGKLIDVPTPEIILDDEISKYNNFFDNLLAKYGVVILPYPEIPIKDIVIKSYEAQKPFKSNREGYKDYVIWETIKDHCNKKGFARRLFITNNTKDFCEKLDDNTLILDPELIATLESPHKAPKVMSLLKSFVNLELKQLALEDIPDFNMPKVTERILENDLPNYPIYRLRGLSFDTDLEIISLIGEPYIDDYDISEVNDDEILIDINGSIPVEVQGSMPARHLQAAKNKNIDFVEDTYKETEWGEEHWVVVSQYPDIFFELTITYSKKNKEIITSELYIP